MHAKNRHINYKPAIFVTLLIVAGIALGMARHCQPVYDDDAAWFMPVSVNQASGYGFRNDWFPDADPEGMGRMVWHGFLGNLIAGRLLWNASYPALFMFQAWTAIAVLVMTGLIFTKVIPKPEDKGHIVAVLSACIFLSGLLPSLFSGRPEPFAALIIVLTVFTLQHTRAGRHWMIIGIGLALLAVTQPTVALIGVSLSMVYLAWMFQPRRMGAELAKAGVVALGLSVLVTLIWHPFGFSDWIKGLLHHAQRTHGYWFASLTWFWLLRPDRFAYGLWYFAAFISLAMIFVRQSMSSVSRILVIIFGVVTIWTVWRFGVWVPATNYNVIAYAPIICLALLYTFIRIAKSNDMPVAIRRITLMVLLTISAIPLTGAIRFVLHPIASRGVGVPFAVARQRLHNLMIENGVVGVSTGLFTLADDQRRIEHIWLLRLKPESDVLMIQQVNTGRRYPVEIEGYTLQEDRFSRESPRLFGFPTGNTPAGYNYSVYSRDTNN